MVDRLALQSEASEEWPRDLLDVDALFRTGWRPQPFCQFILKVHSRCNLACDYCYVYRSADQSWRARSVRMSQATAVQTVNRIAEHVRTHRLPRVAVVVHGGEPLLAGPAFLGFLADTLRDVLPTSVELDICAQTNATLIDSATLGALKEHGIRLGVSLDGDPAVHDARRYHHGGRGSYADVARGLGLLRSPAYRHLFAGLLCVVDPASDPVATYEHLIAYEPPVIDLLLPHANWSNPPRRPLGPSSVPYAGWLIEVFDRWYSSPRPETAIRLFDEIINGLLGRSSRVESVGLAPVRHIVVETDGSIEQVDALKSTYDGAAHTGLHVRDDPFDAALLDPRIAARQIGAGALPLTCVRCDVGSVCGGGYYPHRYRRGAGFRNPSVFCEDLAALIRHIRSRIDDDLARIRVRTPA